MAGPGAGRAPMSGIQTSNPDLCQMAASSARTAASLAKSQESRAVQITSRVIRLNSKPARGTEHSGTLIRWNSPSTLCYRYPT